MRIGASTSNFYPDLTEDALDTLLDMGFDTVEVFLNTVSEATLPYARLLRERAEAAGADIVSVHAHRSLAEAFCLFSLYERRFLDSLDTYRAMFEAAAQMGARYLILHGDLAANPALPPEAFAERYARLYDEGQPFGVTLLQENVVRFRSQSPEFIREMRRLLGDKAQFTLDLKQCRRSGVAVLDMVDAMGDALRHVHVSDGTASADCLLPGRGKENFAALFSALRAVGFDGAVIQELYRQNFGEARELIDGRTALLQYV